jgi:membrane-associated protein
MLDTLKETLLNMDWVIAHGGLFLLLFVIFAETGLFVGFFLPGDSLLFVAGIYIHNFATHFFGTSEANFLHYVMIMLLIAAAGILGNSVGYWFGKKSGPFLYERKDTFWFKKKHLYTAKSFYDKNGAFTIVAARFLPIVRTFAPIVAGIIQMDKKKFTLYNIIGSVAWVFSMMLAGYFLQGLILRWFDFSLKDHLEGIVLGIILVTTLPVIYKFMKSAKQQEAQS